MIVVFNKMVKNQLIFLLLMGVCVVSCKDKTEYVDPTFELTEITRISSNGADLRIQLNHGNHRFEDFGFLISTTPILDISDAELYVVKQLDFRHKHTAGFSVSINLRWNKDKFPMLMPGTEYYVRPFVFDRKWQFYMGSEQTFTTLEVGYEGQGGGIVYYRDGENGYFQTSKRNLEMMLTPIASNVDWGCVSVLDPVPTFYRMGEGLSNTSSIISDCFGTGYAARICMDYEGGGFSNWSLPTHDDFEIAFINLTWSGVPFLDMDKIYWTSTEKNSYSDSEPFALSFQDSVPMLINFPRSSLFHVVTVRTYH
jgi:hypothetical protein